MKGILFAALILGAAAGIRPARAQSPETLLERARAEQSNFLRTWEELVNIDSGTGTRFGLIKVAQILTTRLKALGAAVQTVPTAAPSVGDVVIGSWKGTGSKSIMLMVHYDTVFPPGEAAERPFKTNQNRAYGPGVADAKGGISLILHAAKVLRDLNFDRFANLTVLFNPDEEKGSLGSGALIREYAARHDYVLSFEPPNTDSVTIAVNGVNQIDLEVAGRVSHAGQAPEEGRNAAVELSNQILQLSHLGDPAKGTTVNWTVLQAGEKVNVIPDRAVASADMRYSDYSEPSRVMADANRIIQQKLIPETRATLKLLEKRPPLPRNERSQQLAETAKLIYGRIKRPLASGAMRFGTDAGYAYNPERGKPAVLETLGVIGSNLHTSNEYAELESIVSRLYLATALITELADSADLGAAAP
jgi:glutamate carboxypeptidase